MQTAQKTKKINTGIVLLLIAAAMSSIGGVCIKLSPWQPLSVNGARGLIACVITYCYIKSLKKKIVFNFSTITGALSLCLTMLFHVLANRLTTAAHAILLMYTSPVFVLLFLFVFKNKRANKSEITGVFLVLCGVALICFDGLFGGTVYGDFIGVLSGAAYAGVFLVNTGKGDALSSYFLGQLFAGLMGVPSLIKETVFTPKAITAAVLLGTVQLGLAYIFMAKGLQRTPAVTASIVTCIEPVLCPLWVWLVFGESVSASVALGAVLILISVIKSNANNAKIANADK